jgi:hypothetical protein
MVLVRLTFIPHFYSVLTLPLDKQVQPCSPQAGPLVFTWANRSLLS